MIPKHARPVSWIALALACALTAGAAQAQIETFVEDFTTTEYKDPVNTTAIWDTVAGEIRLPDFAISETSFLATGGTAEGAVIAFDKVFVPAGAAGLLIIDLFDLAVPALTGSYGTTGFAADVALSGDHAYVAAMGGMEVVNIASLASPAYAGAYATTGPATGIAVAGDRAYVAAGGAGLVVLDITTPATPTFVGSYTNSIDDATDVAVDGDLAFVGTTAGLEVLDVSGATPVLLGSYAAGSVEAVAVDGNRVYLAAGASGLVIVDVTSPATPTLAGSVVTPGTAKGLVVDGDFVYVADGGAGFTVVDASSPGLPVLVDTFDTPGDARGAAFSGLWAFVADGSGGLRVLEMRDLVQAMPVGNHTLASAGSGAGGLGATLAGDYLYIAEGSAGIEVVDIGDATIPSQAGVYDLATGLDVAHDVAVAGDHLYVAWGDTGLVVLDVSDPTTPAWAGGFDGNVREAIALDVEGDLVYLAREHRLQILDVSNPATPALVATFDPSPAADFVLDVDVEGNYAYLACDTDGLMVVDVSNPALPVSVALFAPFGDGYFNVTIEGDRAFCGGLFGDLGITDVIDISDPSLPVIDNYTGIGGTSTDIDVHGITLAGSYLSDDGYGSITGGFEVLDIHGMDEILDYVVLARHNTNEAGRAVEVAGDYVYLLGDSRLDIVRIYNHSYESSTNVVRSLAVASDVVAVRLTTTQTGTIDWQVGPTVFLEAISVTPGVWTALPDLPEVPLELGWRANFLLDGSGVRPTCSHLQLEFTHPWATIDSIVDVPDDQGGWARLHFLRSGRDFNDSPSRVNDYVVWRRIDTAALKVLSDGPAPRSSGPDYGAKFPALPLVERSGRWFLDPLAKSVPAGFPPGDWEILGSFPALRLENYTYLVPTQGDDPVQSVHVVTAHSDNEFWVSPPDSGSSRDNLAPGVPLAVTADYEAAGVTLDWDDAPESDFQYFRVYRGLDPGFVPAPEYLVHETANSAWTDPTALPWDFHYRITALDHAGNESEAGAPGAVSGVPDAAVPARTALMGAVPNPFNPSTTLSFETAVAGPVRLVIYDAAGRLVRTLVSEHRPAGRHAEVWDGRDTAGRTTAAGVYLYRLEAADYVATKRMVLLK